MSIKIIILTFALLILRGPFLFGTILYSGVVNLSLDHSSNMVLQLEMINPIYSLSVVSGRDEFTLQRDPFSQAKFFSIFDANTGFVDSFGWMTSIDESADWRQIITSRNLVSYKNEALGNLFNQSNRYIPFRILGNEEMFFGWMRMSHSMAEERLTIHDWAWNSAPGEPILAGQIPEPRTTVLLAGLCALLAAAGWRWRKAAG